MSQITAPPRKHHASTATANTREDGRELFDVLLDVDRPPLSRFRHLAVLDHEGAVPCHPREDSPFDIEKRIDIVESRNIQALLDFRDKAIECVGTRLHEHIDRHRSPCVTGRQRMSGRFLALCDLVSM